MMSYGKSAVEARARRAAKKVGLLARKSRRRAGSTENFGHFMLLDVNGKRAVAGLRYDLKAQQVIDYCWDPVAASASAQSGSVSTAN